jgi:hypothetical protein
MPPKDKVIRGGKSMKAGQHIVKKKKGRIDKQWSQQIYVEIEEHEPH